MKKEELIEAKGEIDFENYNIDKEVAEKIRGELSALEQSSWPGDFRFLAKELGEDFIEDDQNTLQLISTGTKGAKKNDAIKVWQGQLSEDAQLKAILDASELKVFFNDSALFELSFLPKDDRFILFHLNAELWSQFLELPLEELKSSVQTARDAKRKRFASFRK